MRKMWRSQIVFGFVLWIARAWPAIAGGDDPNSKVAGSGVLHLSLIDQLPPQPITGETALYSLEERQRLPVFDAALQEVVNARKLPPSVLINSGPELRSGVSSEKPQPPGTVIVRVFVTQWAQTHLGGSADTEVLCRIFVEQMRDGQRIAKLGPFLGRVHRDIALAAPSQNERASFQAAARQVIEQLAAELPR